MKRVSWPRPRAHTRARARARTSPRAQAHTSARTHRRTHRRESTDAQHRLRATPDPPPPPSLFPGPARGGRSHCSGERGRRPGSSPKEPPREGKHAKSIASYRGQHGATIDGRIHCRSPRRRCRVCMRTMERWLGGNLLLR